MARTKKLTLFQEARMSLQGIIDDFISYRNKEGKDVNPLAISMLKDAISHCEMSQRAIERYEKFLYFAGKGDTLFFVNNETGEISRGSIEQVIKATRRIEEVFE